MQVLGLRLNPRASDRTPGSTGTSHAALRESAPFLKSRAMLMAMLTRVLSRVLTVPGYSYRTGRSRSRRTFDGMHAGEEGMARLDALVLRLLFLDAFLVGTGCTVHTHDRQALYAQRLGQRSLVSARSPRGRRSTGGWLRPTPTCMLQPWSIYPR